MVSPGRIVLPYLSAYTISKYGVSAFSDALRREMFPWGVHVSIIEAGAHKTKLVSGDVLAEQWQSLWNGLSEEMKREYGGKEGLRRGNLITSFPGAFPLKVGGAPLLSSREKL